MRSEFSAVLSRIDPPAGVPYEDILRASEVAAERVSEQVFDGESTLVRARAKLIAALGERNRILGVA